MGRSIDESITTVVFESAAFNTSVIARLRPLGAWIGAIERARGLLASLVEDRGGVSPAAAQAIHRILANAAEITAMAWHSGDAFLRGDEAHGAPSP